MSDRLLAASLSMTDQQIEMAARMTTDDYVQAQLTQARCALANAIGYIRHPAPRLCVSARDSSGSATVPVAVGVPPTGQPITTSAPLR